MMNLKVSISCKNRKMGPICSVSLPPITTCVKCDCNRKCYSLRDYKRYPATRSAYDRNLEIATKHPDAYWRQVEDVIMLNRYFRFHVGGDIPNKEYFEKMVEVCARWPHCEALCFTKKFSIVNEYINAGGEIPSNLHIIFSGWKGLEMDNPHNMPECHVRFKDGHCDAKEGAYECGGNCTECNRIKEGCWTLKKGEQVVINQH